MTRSSMPRPVIRLRIERLIVEEPLRSCDRALLARALETNLARHLARGFDGNAAQRITRIAAASVAAPDASALGRVAGASLAHAIRRLGRGGGGGEG
jgi:hypothetical protein